ncbi:MAG: hypothetical protein AB1894_26785, partial [Chloroflexota bacterium]
NAACFRMIWISSSRLRSFKSGCVIVLQSYQISTLVSNPVSRYDSKDILIIFVHPYFILSLNRKFLSAIAALQGGRSGISLKWPNFKSRTREAEKKDHMSPKIYGSNWSL